MKTVIVWFRNDLRIHDHPALSAAVEKFDRVVPVFIFDDKLLGGRHASANRHQFLLEATEDLKNSLKSKGGDLVIRRGEAPSELKKIVRETNAEAVFYTSDFSPYALRRDKRVEDILSKQNIEVKNFPGRMIVNSVSELKTKSGNKPFKVFTPFWRQWQQQDRRQLLPAPDKINFPSGIKVGQLPKSAIVLC
jgi:deoxyribodipyrimidine photo-lyase